MTGNHVETSSVIHPVVVVKINGVKFRALLDSGASHSYASSTALKLIGAKVKSVSHRQIATSTGVTSGKMLVFEVQIQSLSEDYTLNVNITKIDKEVLLKLKNTKKFSISTRIFKTSRWKITMTKHCCPYI